MSCQVAGIATRGTALRWELKFTVANNVSSSHHSHQMLTVANNPSSCFHSYQ